jgi:hypothetical protein
MIRRKQSRKWIGRVYLLCGGIIAALSSPTGSAQEADSLAKYRPKDWLAFVDVRGGFISELYTDSWDSPEILVFQDGRIIWLEPGYSYAEDGHENPEIWREGTVSPDRLAVLVKAAERNQFLTVQPEPQRPGRGWISDLAETGVGLAVGGHARKLTVYALGFFSGQPRADPYTRTAAVMANAIWALKPASSHRYVPDAIRVAVVTDDGRGPQPVPWPLPDPPTLMKSATSGFNYYSGPDALAVIIALSKSTRVKVGERIFQAAWGPAILTP